MNAPAKKIEVLANLKLATGALSAHGEHERVDQLLDVIDVVSGLVKSHRDLYVAYVRLLEASRDRISSLGGVCHPVDVLERNDSSLSEARAVLSRIAVTP